MIKFIIWTNDHILLLFHRFGNNIFFNVKKFAYHLLARIWTSRLWIDPAWLAAIQRTIPEWTSCLYVDAENGKYTSCVVSKSLRICRIPGICTNGVPSARVHVIVGAGIPNHFQLIIILFIKNLDLPLALQVIILPVSFENITKLGGSTKNSGPRFSGWILFDDNDNDCDNAAWALCEKKKKKMKPEKKFNAHNNRFWFIFQDTKKMSKNLKFVIKLY